MMIFFFYVMKTHGPSPLLGLGGRQRHGHELHLASHESGKSDKERDRTAASYPILRHAAFLPTGRHTLRHAISHELVCSDRRT